jgi:hypothetical protein
MDASWSLRHAASITAHAPIAQTVFVFIGSISLCPFIIKVCARRVVGTVHQIIIINIGTRHGEPAIPSQQLPERTIMNDAPRLSVADNLVKFDGGHIGT